MFRPPVTAEAATTKVRARAKVAKATALVFFRSAWRTQSESISWMDAALPPVAARRVSDARTGLLSSNVTPWEETRTRPGCRAIAAGIRSRSTGLHVAQPAIETTMARQRAVSLTPQADYRRAPEICLSSLMMLSRTSLFSAASTHLEGTSR